MPKICFVLLLLWMPMISPAQEMELIHLHEDLQIQILKEHVWVHRSWTSIEPYGRFYSNGLIYVNGNQCLVFDTPIKPDLSDQLIQWLQEEKGLTIAAIIVNHFHEDCLGGLEQFHQAGIPSYASRKTIKKAQQQESAIPMNGFGRKKIIAFSEEEVHLYYPGAAHSPDNIVAWLPAEQTLFGGCMVKSMGAGKGNLADADVSQWPKTIQKVKKRFPQVEYVIPGHGKAGGLELLDYTITLFSKE